MRSRGFLLVLLAGLALAACKNGPPPPPAPIEAAARCPGEPLSAMGDATYYDATGAGSCSFPPSTDHLVAALNGPDYGHAAWCGACLAVAGPLGAVVVRVVDSCPGCKHGDLDLAREAFAQIAPLSAGRARVAWHEVACPVTGPIVYQIKAGSNRQWTAIQLRNHRYAIDRLEARDAAGAYHAIARGDDNYFVASNGLGPGPFALRTVDVHGHTLDDLAIDAGAGVARPGAGQFPLCP
jgi:expansin (peptidoglycan-binding protein)